MKNTPSSTLFILTGIIIGGLLALCEHMSISAHLPFIWLSTFGFMFLLALPYTNKVSTTFLITLIPSFLASIPCLWLLDASIPYFSSVILAAISAYALNAFHLHYYQRRFQFSYAILFHAVWDTFIQLLITAIFTVLCWVILSLAASLFDLAKIDFLRKLLSKNWFQWWSTALFVSIGLYITTQTRDIIRNIRGILLLICQWLFIPLAIIGLIFIVLSLATRAFTFNQTYFISIAFLCVIFINGIYQDGAAKNPYKKWMATLGQLFLIVTPLFSLLALCAVIFSGNNSIKTNGINTANFPFFLNVILLLIYNFSYAFIALLHEKTWLRSIEKTNVVLAFLLVASTILTTNPWFLKVLPTPKNNPYFNRALTPDEQNKQLMSAFQSAGFRWKKPIGIRLPADAIALGYNKGPVYFCRPTAENNTGGIVKNNQCEWISQNKIQKTRSFTVLSGSEKKLLWAEWKFLSSYNHRFLIILDNAKKPTAICRLIYQNRITIGTSDENDCVFIANGKIMREKQLLQFLYHQ
ncbi:MAG: hypothetical protein Q8L78_05635 [Coxiellaceae bacterium]|nr:hypothetical protein [Coxiellaceae bacterium]